VKKTQNKGYYGVQGHSRSLRSVPSVTAESLRAKRDLKSAISLQRSHFDTKFQVEEVALHQSFLHS